MSESSKLYGDVDLLLQINRDSIEMDHLLKNICLETEQKQSHN